jgi:hypothetical protein
MIPSEGENHVMAWADDHGIAARLSRTAELAVDRLPLVLCGPILRRVEPDSVTVWVALKEPSTVTLRVYAHHEPPEMLPLREELQGTAETVPLGANLHVVAITARPVTADRPLVPGLNYFYNLFFGPPGGAVVPETGASFTTISLNDVLGSSLEDPEPSLLSYSVEHRLPGFSLPPTDVNKLRIIHGTCRKPDGVGKDAMPGIDAMIADTWSFPDERPHLLLLNGDQIYADDVSGLLLFLLMDAGKALLDWNEGERLPDVPDTRFRELKPGNRRKLVYETAKLTTEDPDNHILTFGEFCAMYLVSWSHTLWPVTFPEAGDVFEDAPDARSLLLFANLYADSRATLIEFVSTLRQVRRVLANVPSYMMFDDHDVTDDWNMIRAWCERVYKQPLGRRVVQNGLATYAVFQAWGNTPERFAAGEPGGALLGAIAAWSDSKGMNTTAEQQIGRIVGIPESLTNPFTPGPGLVQLTRASDALQWHYSIQGPNFEILMLDTRTRRGYGQDRGAAPAHIAPAAMAEQIPLDDLDPDKLHMVVMTSNMFTIPLFFGTKVFGDRFIYSWWYIAMWLILELKAILTFFRSLPLPFAGLIPVPKESLYNPDLKDSWEPQSRAYESVLSRLARRTAVRDGRRTSRVLMLSGDVHASWAARMRYSAPRPFEAPPSAEERVEAIFAHLTSSPLKKEEPSLGDKLHRFGYIPMSDSLPGSIQWLGWREPTAIGVSPNDMMAAADWRHYEPFMFRKSPPMLSVRDADISVPLPDWRYRLDFILGEKSDIRLGPPLLTKPNPSDHEHWLDVFKEMQERYRDYAQKFGDGLEIVGRNNFAELRFQWQGTANLVSAISATDVTLQVVDAAPFPAAPLLVKIENEILEIGTIDRPTNTCSKLKRGQHGTSGAAYAPGTEVEVFKSASQTHWWRLTGETRLMPLTRYMISLRHDDPQFPIPGGSP